MKINNLSINYYGCQKKKCLFKFFKEHVKVQVNNFGLAQEGELNST